MPSSTTDPGGSTAATASSTAADSSTGVAAACSDSPDALADCVQEDLYLASLEFVAQTRSPTEPHWQVVQDHLAEQLAEFGYEVELDVYDTGVNVIGRLRGTLGTSDVLVSAHYDSVSDCQGADDNAGGVAGALEAARVLAMGEYEQDLVIAFWDQEELGLIGADSYVERAFERGDSIAALYNLEMIGYTDDSPGAQTIPAGFDALFPVGYAQIEDNELRGDFITVVADDLIAEGAAALLAQAERLDLPAVHIELNADLKNNPQPPDLRRPDHAPFWEVDYPALMSTDPSAPRVPHDHRGPAPAASATCRAAPPRAAPPGPRPRARPCPRARAVRAGDGPAGVRSAGARARRRSAVPARPRAWRAALRLRRRAGPPRRSRAAPV